MTGEHSAWRPDRLTGSRPPQRWSASSRCFGMGPRDRAEIANELRMREGVLATVLTAMLYRDIVGKERDKYLLRKSVAE